MTRKKNPSIDQTELVRVVAEDILYLRENWNRGTSEVALRNGSVILHKLLVEGGSGLLRQAWNVLGLGKGPLIPTPRPFHFAGVWPVFSTTAIAWNGLAMIGSFKFWDRALNRDEGRASRYADDPQGGNLQFEDLPIPGFVGSTSVTCRGVSVLRGSVVRYLAYKRGGKHLDSSRESDALGKQFEILDKTRLEPLQMLGLELSFFEALSVAQLLFSAPDVSRFLDVALPNHPPFESHARFWRMEELP
jgi:hypothetical protein